MGFNHDSSGSFIMSPSIQNTDVFGPESIVRTRVCDRVCMWVACSVYTLTHIILTHTPRATATLGSQIHTVFPRPAAWRMLLQSSRRPERQPEQGVGRARRVERALRPERQPERRREQGVGRARRVKRALRPERQSERRREQGVGRARRVERALRPERQPERRREQGVGRPLRPERQSERRLEQGAEQEHLPVPLRNPGRDRSRGRLPHCSPHLKAPA
jgi:hypothetical protein